MDYTAFLETVKQALMQKLGEGQDLLIRPVPKNNGVILDGLSIHSQDSPHCPNRLSEPLLSAI